MPRKAREKHGRGLARVIRHREGARIHVRHGGSQQPGSSGLQAPCREGRANAAARDMRACTMVAVSDARAVAATRSIATYVRECGSPF